MTLYFNIDNGDTLTLV